MDLNIKTIFFVTHGLGPGQPRPQGAFPWLWEKRPGDEVGAWKTRSESRENNNPPVRGK